MPQSNYPSNTDLINFLTAAGAWEDTFTPFASGFVNKAATEFEMLTGRIPFIAETSPSTSFFNPPGSISVSNWMSWRGGGKFVEFDSGFTQIHAMYIGSTYDSFPGSTLDINRNVFFYPLNHIARRLPIEAAEIRFPVWGIGKSLVVIGTRGYSTTVPDDVWMAVLQRAAALFLSQIGALANTGAAELSEADVTIRYGSAGGAYAFQIENWNSEFQSVVSRYKLIRMELV